MAQSRAIILKAGKNHEKNALALKTKYKALYLLYQSENPNMNHPVHTNYAVIMAIYSRH